MQDKELEQLKSEFRRNRVVGFSHNVTTGKSHWHLKAEGVTTQIEYSAKNDPERMVNEFNIAVIDDVALVYEDYFLSNNAYWTLFVKAFHKSLSYRMHKAGVPENIRGRIVGQATKNLKDSLKKKYGKIEYGVFSEKDTEVLSRMKKEYDTPVPRYY